MSEEGIVESTPATVIKRTKVDWNIETPIIGSDSGDDLGTQTSRISGVHRSKYVTKQGRIVKEYDDELDYQDLSPLEGSATDAVRKEKEAAEDKSAWDAVIAWGWSKINGLSDQLHKTSKLPGESIVKLGDNPDDMTDAKYAKWEEERRQDQQLAAYIEKRDRKGE